MCLGLVDLNLILLKLTNVLKEKVCSKHLQFKWADCLLSYDDYRESVAFNTGKISTQTLAISPFLNE